MYNLFPASHIDAVTFKKDGLKGHYGNPINVFRTRIKDGEVIEAFVEKLFTKLSDLDKETIVRELNLFVEKNNLYLSDRISRPLSFFSASSIPSSDSITSYPTSRTPFFITYKLICSGLYSRGQLSHASPTPSGVISTYNDLIYEKPPPRPPPPVP